MLEEENNDDFFIEMEKIRTRHIAGCDERFEKDTPDPNILFRINTNIMKLQLLNVLKNSKISLAEKEIVLNKNKYLFDEMSMSISYNISAGGLWKDFYTEI